MNYENLLSEIELLKKKYNVKVIGKTKFNRKIFAVERIINKSFSTAIFVGGVHARENITCDLLVKMLNENLFDEIDNFNLSFVVMANPDGVDLQSGNITIFPAKWQKKLIDMNNGSSDFSMWKANALGVDINNNFDAKFGTNTHSDKPCMSGFCGNKAESELETKALVQYTLKTKPFFTISYHSKGEEIYYDFYQDKRRKGRDKKIAEKFAKSTGYTIKSTQEVSSGGYKDWCVQKLKIPAITIEVGDDDWQHPISKNHLQEIYEKNKMIAKDLKFAYNEYVKEK